MPTYVQVSVNIPAVSGVFDYHLPEVLAGKVMVGHLLVVPFGEKTVQGVVLRFVETPAVAKTKEVLDILDETPVLNAAQIALAEKMAEETLNPLAAMVGMMLPSGLSQQADVQYSVVSSQSSAVSEQLSQTQKRIVDLLQKRGALRGRQIDRHFKKVDWRPSAQNLVRRGILRRKSVLPMPTVRPKYVRTAQLAVSLAEAEDAAPKLGSTEQTQIRREAALRFLMREKDAVAVSWVYAESGANLSDLKVLAEKDLIILRETEIWRDPVQRVTTREEEGKEHRLNAAQKAAMEAINASFAASLTRPILLHGITGSGKTEVYIRAAQEAVRLGGQALILVPEISLTPQTLRRFLARFPGRVGLIHSKLSMGENYDTWRRAREGKLNLIIGARSALFAPLPNIKLIVLDEFHDYSYHQNQPPFYNAVQAAKNYAQIWGAVCILGSATPTIAERYHAEQRAGAQLVELPHRIAERELPPVDVVDMRAELKSGGRGIFSRALREALSETLARGEQAILFLNRRGTATYVFCRECGQSLECPRCDIPLTLHATPILPQDHARVKSAAYRGGALQCHRCGYTRQMPRKCPTCESQKIRAYGLGSEKVEDEVNALFPEARTLRWDWDTTRTKDAHEIILGHFTAHRADVLIGTQMLAKGLDLPLVTFVGIVLADVGLNLPDPFAAERAFQTLTQVAGRAGRSARGGRVVLQSFTPEHDVIRFAARHDYAGFYAKELENRRMLGYPPFAKLIRLEYRHRDATIAEEEARKLAENLKIWIRKEGRRRTTIIGPVPCFFAKVDEIYRWQVILRGPEPESLLRDKELRGWRVEVEPVSLL